MRRPAFCGPSRARGRVLHVAITDGSLPDPPRRCFPRQEALALGVAEHRLRDSDLTSPVGRGVRVPAGCPAPLLEAARALTRRYPGTVISHRSAALLHRMQIGRAHV